MQIILEEMILVNFPQIQEHYLKLTTIIAIIIIIKNSNNRILNLKNLNKCPLIPLRDLLQYQMLCLIQLLVNLVLNNNNKNQDSMVLKQKEEKFNNIHSLFLRIVMIN